MFGIDDYRRDADLDVVGAACYGALYALHAPRPGELRHGRERATACSATGYRELGLVNDVFTQRRAGRRCRRVQYVPSATARYATSGGRTVRSNAQPMVSHHMQGHRWPSGSQRQPDTTPAELRSQAGAERARSSTPRRTPRSSAYLPSPASRLISSGSIEQAAGRKRWSRLQGAYSAWS